jgi:hypothetical protein
LQLHFLGCVFSPWENWMKKHPQPQLAKNLSHSYFTHLLTCLVWFGSVCFQTHENSTSATEALKIATN